MKRSVKTNEMIVAEETFSLANYPACKVFYDCDPSRVTEGLAAAAILEDLVTGNQTDCSANVSAGFAVLSDGGVQCLVGASGVIGTHVAGSPDLPIMANTKHQVCIVVGDFGSTLQDGLAIGSWTTNEERFSFTNTLGLAAADGTNSVPAGIAAITDASTEAAASFLDWTNSEFTAYETDGALAELVETASGATFDITDAIDLSAVDNCFKYKASTGETIVLYGIALFEFTDVPSSNDILQAMSWCNYQWRNGNQGILPPSFKNRI